MLDRRVMLAAAGLTIVAGVRAKAAAMPFTLAAFEAAQKDGKSIIVAVHAPWCPTCRVQEPIMLKLLSEDKYRNVVLFHVDFDSQKDALRRFNASKQSTLIGFKGMKETRRSTGDTESMTIEDLIESTL